MFKFKLKFSRQTYYFGRGSLQKFLQVGNYVTQVSDNVTVSFAPKYNSKDVEINKYHKWDAADYFKPKHETTHSNDLEIFSMILPPPNITGTLHLGHALTVTIQDILCRWKRMQGYSVLWVPGTDHAGIATQVVVERHLQQKTGSSRKAIGREKFLGLVLEWKAVKMNKIIDQLKQLGASVDWSKFTFTMDDKQSVAVVEALIKLFDDGMLYRENAPINWSCHLQSTISDIEVDYVSLDEPTFLSVPGHDHPIEFGLMYDFAFKVINSDDEVVISTTRPETIFGDTAVAVHPDDTRYSHLRDAFLHHPVRRCPIPVIFDERVDPNFGTGAVKITPGHSRIDFEISKKHNLPFVTIFTETGVMNDLCEDCAHVPRFMVREKVIVRLSNLGLLRGVKRHEMRIPICGRSGDIVEQMVKPQWFLKCHKLAERALEAAENGSLDISPERHLHTYCEWLKNMKDWCISRQLWWGHRLPLYKTECGWIAARSIEEARIKAKETFNRDCLNIEQDEDVLDTWFSSALLPFSVFNWPQTGADFEKCYPLSLMETGADILNFWVVRMIMIGLYFTKKLPFNKVFLHGMICDSSGRKMSKSLGNIIEPDHIINGISLQELNEIVDSNCRNGLIAKEELDMAFDFQEKTFPKGIPRCGADALRLTLICHNVTSALLHFKPDECHENTRFCNKMWQASKFTIGWALKFDLTPASVVNPIFPWHFWLLHRLSYTVKAVNKNLEEMCFNEVSNVLKQFFHHDFCDIFVEVSKPILKNGSEEEAKVTCSVMLYCLETYLRLISPIMPFIADELYSYLPECSERLVANEKFPTVEEYQCWENETVNEEMEFVKDTTRCIRALVDALRCKKAEADVVIVTEKKDILNRYSDVIHSLTRCNSVIVSDSTSSEIVAPANPLKDNSVAHVLLKNITNAQVIDNFKLLDSQILRSQYNIKLMLSSDNVSKNDDSQLIGLLEEWKNFEVKMKKSLDSIDVANVTLEDVRTLIHFIKVLRLFDCRFQQLWETLDISNRDADKIED